MPQSIQTSGAHFSPCRTWRYTLWRIWNPALPYMAFIGLNPSTADEVRNDPTVTRCQNYARAWGYGGLYMLNIFALRATDPRVMKADLDPVGPDNDAAIMRVSLDAGLVVCGWGNHGSHLGRSRRVVEMLQDAGVALHCLKVTGAGEPGHPLYLRGDLRPGRFDL